jgi:hypothetical protein
MIFLVFQMLNELDQAIGQTALLFDQGPQFLAVRQSSGLLASLALSELCHFSGCVSSIVTHDISFDKLIPPCPALPSSFTTR